MADAIPNKKKSVFLTDRQKREMFERWDTGRYTQMELAEWYGCSQQTISNLISQRDELNLGNDGEPHEVFDALAMPNVEEFLENIAIKLSKMVEKVPDTKFENIPMMTKAAKTVLDIRKQLRELPKDLHTKSVPMNIETALKLAELIPPEHRERYMQLMRDLAQPQGELESDLGRRKRPPVLKRPSPGTVETNDSSSPGEIDEASEESKDDELPDISLVKPKETKTPGVDGDLRSKSLKDSEVA